MERDGERTLEWLKQNKMLNPMLLWVSTERRLY